MDCRTNADTGALAGAESLVQVRISVPQSIDPSEGGAWVIAIVERRAS